MEVYIDSNIFIYYSNYPKNNHFRKISEQYLNNLSIKKFTGITSYLTWDEIVWAIHNDMGKSLKDAASCADCFFQILNLEYKEIDVAILKKAKGLIDLYGTRPRDAIHASLALKYANGFIVSSDPHFDGIKDIARVFEYE